jgi:parvulin-like peptidyl-prolyl isomerase
LFRGARRYFGLTAVLGLLAGCGEGGGGSEGKIVATAGSEIQITLADFQQSFNQITQTYRPDISTLEGKRSFANDLVNREILLDEAYKLGGISDPKILTHVESARNGQMLRLLYRNEVEAKVDVLGRDVAELYEKRKLNVRASHILLDDMEAAARIREEIVGGQLSFAQAARKYSIDQSTREAGGSLGELQWSRRLPEFHAKAFELEPGIVSEPVETPIGVHLIVVDEVLPQELESLEALRPGLRTEARQHLEVVRLNEFVAELEEKAGLTWHDDALRTLLSCIVTEAAKDIDTIPQNEWHVPDATPEQRKMDVATFSGGSWTIGDYIGFIQSQPPQNRPVTRLPFNGLKEYVRTTQLQEKLLVAEALERGYDQDPEVQKADKRMREQILVNLVHSRFLQAADVPEEDARAIYDSTKAENPDALLIAERVDMVVFVHNDPEVVHEGLRRIASGEAESLVLSELSLDFRTKSKGGRTGLVARGNYAPQLEELAFSGRVGEGWSEVIVTESGAGTVKVLAHEEPRLATFEEMREPLMQNLLSARGENAFEEWLTSRRNDLGVEIHDEVLELIGQSVS